MVKKVGGKFRADTYKIVDGKRKRVRKFFNNKLDAHTWESLHRRDKDQRTIDDLIKHYQERPRYDRLRATSKVRYGRLLKHLREWCIARDIISVSDFGRDEAQGFELYCHKKFKRKGVKSALVLAKTVFQEELRRSNPAIDRNPFEIVDMPKIDKKPPRPLSEEELNALLEVVDSPFYKHAFIFTAFTGLRRDELRFLQIADVKNNEVIVREKSDFSPKTKESTRRVPITDAVKPSIAFFLDRNKGKKYFLMGEKPASQGRLWEAYDRYKRKVKGFNLLDTKFHTLRATYGYLALKNGASYASVKEALGHSSILVTEQNYAKLLPQDVHTQIATAMNRITLGHSPGHQSEKAAKTE